jgi:hypothetical protein
MKIMKICFRKYCPRAIANETWAATSTMATILSGLISCMAFRAKGHTFCSKLRAFVATVVIDDLSGTMHM